MHSVLAMNVFYQILSALCYSKSKKVCRKGEKKIWSLKFRSNIFKCMHALTWVCWQHGRTIIIMIHSKVITEFGYIIVYSTTPDVLTHSILYFYNEIYMSYQRLRTT